MHIPVPSMVAPHEDKVVSEQYFQPLTKLLFQHLLLSVACDFPLRQLRHYEKFKIKVDTPFP